MAAGVDSTNDDVNLFYPSRILYSIILTYRLFSSSEFNSLFFGNLVDDNECEDDFELYNIKTCCIAYSVYVLHMLQTYVCV